MNHDPYNMEDINDIVLNRNGNDKSASVKKILTALAILIILFLIVLIIMKFINRGNIDTSANLQMPSEAELAKKEQQPKLQPVVIEQKKDEPKAEVKKPEPKPEPKVEPKPQIKIEQEPDNKFEIKREDTQPKEQIIEIKKEEPKVEPKKEQIVINEPKKEQIIINEPKVEPKKAEPKVEPKKAEPKVEPKKEQPKAEQPKKQEPKKAEPKVEPKKVEPKVEPKKVEPKKEQPKVEQPKKVEPKKPEPKAEPKTQKGGSPKDVSSLSSGTYVQVYALSQYSSTSPSVKKIAEKGYTPLAYKSGNITRILVGPFTTNDELNKALSQMRTLSKDAFVHRVK